MKKYLPIAVVLLAFLTVVWGHGTQAPTQWEYKFDYKCSEKRTNDLASQGWELVNLSESSNGVLASQTCAFKRMRVR